MDDDMTCPVCGHETFNRADVIRLALLLGKHKLRGHWLNAGGCEFIFDDRKVQVQDMCFNCDANTVEEAFKDETKARTD